jgi:hypothetical protein
VGPTGNAGQVTNTPMWNVGMAAKPHTSCRPRSTSRLGRVTIFPTAFLRLASEPGPAGRRAAHLRSEAGRASTRPVHAQRRSARQAGPTTGSPYRCSDLRFWSPRSDSNDDLPITRRSSASTWTGSRRIWPAHVGWLVGPDGSRRVQKDRLDDHWEDQGPSDRVSDGKASCAIALASRSRFAPYPNGP